MNTGISAIRDSIRHLNPKQVREQSERSLRIAMYANSDEAYRRLETYLTEGLTPPRMADSLATLSRGPDPKHSLDHDLAVYDDSVIAPARALVFNPRRPDLFVNRALEAHPDLGVALARRFPPFRNAFVDRTIRRISRENAFFSIASALPDVIPSIIELPWAVAEFASDSAFITMNQIRMGFLIAAASDRPVGYIDQKSEIASVIAGAFGWRALSRQLVGKIPFGGGLLPKAGIAYAATMVEGLSLDRLYRVGYPFTAEERERAYGDAFGYAWRAARSLLHRLRPDLADRASSEAGHERAYQLSRRQTIR